LPPSRVFIASPAAARLEVRRAEVQHRLGRAGQRRVDGDDVDAGREGGVDRALGRRRIDRGQRVPGTFCDRNVSRMDSAGEVAALRPLEVGLDAEFLGRVGHPGLASRQKAEDC